MKTRFLIPMLLLPSFALLASCKEKGPAEKIGEQIDKSAEKVKDAVDPKGPVEKEGEKVDKAIGN
jgi:predicted small secreted protein